MYRGSSLKWSCHIKGLGQQEIPSAQSVILFLLEKMGISLGFGFCKQSDMLRSLSQYLPLL